MGGRWHLSVREGGACCAVWPGIAARGVGKDRAALFVAGPEGDVDAVEGLIQEGAELDERVEGKRVVGGEEEVGGRCGAEFEMESLS